MRMNLYEKEKAREMVIVICGIKNSLTCTKVLGSVACRVTTKVLGIGGAEHSLGDV